MPRKSKIKDMAQIETAFCSGEVSIKQIGATYGISEGYIYAVAKKKGWKRVSKIKQGRQSEYTEEKAKAICDAIAQDEGSLKAICAKPGNPSVPTVMLWMSKNEDFLILYTRAREQQAEASSHRMRQIEDQVLTGEVDPNAARVVIDSIKWRASKLAPKKFGDKLQVDTKIEDARRMSDTDLDAEITASLGRLGIKT